MTAFSDQQATLVVPLVGGSHVINHMYYIYGVTGAIAFAAPPTTVAAGATARRRLTGATATRGR